MNGREDASIRIPTIPIPADLITGGHSVSEGGDAQLECTALHHGPVRVKVRDRNKVPAGAADCPSDNDMHLLE